MTGQNVRMMKEARALFWPWCLVVLMAAVNVLAGPQDFREQVSLLSALGFCIGIPLLAVLPFGNEFQNRTISLLLAQPVRRLQIWSEKLVVMLAAVVSA